MRLAIAGSLFKKVPTANIDTGVFVDFKMSNNEWAIVKSPAP